MNRSFYLKTKILLGFGLILGAIVLTAVIAYQSYEQLSHSVQVLSRQDTRLQHIDSILVMVNQSENRLQEYTIDKSPDKLSDYDSLVSNIRGRVQALKATSSYDNNKLDSILNLINVKLVSMDEFMEIREQRDNFRFYDQALQQLEQEPTGTSAQISSTQQFTPANEADSTKQREITEIENEAENMTEAQQEDAEKEKGWFKNIINKIFNNNKAEVDTSAEKRQIVDKSEVLPQEDTLVETTPDLPNLSIDSVRQMLLTLKSEQAATEAYLNQQELAYLATNAQVMNRTNELIAEVKTLRQQQYARQSQEARAMLQISLSRLGIILVITLGSTFLFVYLIFADIAKSDFLKQQLEQAKEKAEQLARIKEEFLANMSHEIRTPLTAILGFSGLLKDSQLSSRQQEYVDAVDSSSSHLLSLVNDILDFSKIEAGQLKFESEAFDIIMHVEQVCADMRIQAEKKGLQLITEKEGEALRYVKGDAFRLKQVLYNLISNAIKFTEEGGVIIRTRLKPLDKHRISVQLEVIDSGVGISQEKQDHIFDAFVQSDVSDTRKYGGTGLGLSISKRIVEGQNGQIMLESNIGEGTTFYIGLPFLKADASEVTEQKSATWEHLSFPGLKLLVIDDDPLNTQLLSVMLERRGVECLVAQSGQEGLDMLQSEKVDLVLTDLQMPEMPGEEVVATVRKMDIADLAVLAFTARVTEHKGYFRQKGFDGVLHKPFSEEDVVELLRKYAASYALDTPKNNSEPDKGEALSGQSVTGEMYSLSNIRRFIGDDEEALINFIASFLKGLRESIASMEAAIQENDMHTIGYHAHRLYSNVAQLQVPELPALLRKMENDSKLAIPSNTMEEDVQQAVLIARRLEASLQGQQENLKAKAD